MKPVLKAPGSIVLKHRNDGRLSKFAFKFNLRRYTMHGMFQQGCGFQPAARGLGYLECYDYARHVLEDGSFQPGARVLGYVERYEYARQGLTLVHFSAQLEPCVAQENTYTPLNTP